MSAALDDLKDDPEFTTIDFRGKKRGFLLTVWGARMARRDMDIDFVERLFGLAIRLVELRSTLSQNGEQTEDEDTEEDEEVTVQDYMDTFSKADITSKDFEAFGAALYAGLKPFSRELEPEDVLLGLTPGRIMNLLPVIGGHIFSFMEDQMDLEDDLPDQKEEESEDTVGKETSEA